MIKIAVNPSNLLYAYSDGLRVVLVPASGSPREIPLASADEVDGVMQYIDESIDRAMGVAPHPQPPAPPKTPETQKPATKSIGFHP